MSVVIMGRPKPPQPKKKCGCHWEEQPGGMHHGRNVWTLRYEWKPCKKHSGGPSR